MMISVMAAMVLAAAPVSMEFDGTLKDGLKQLAQKSGLNLVVIGEFDEHVNLNFPSVNGEEALETIAQAYGLEVTRSGKNVDAKLWVIRRASAPTVGPNVPPVVPLQNLSPDAAREAAEQSRAAAEAAREQADELRQKAEAMREAAEQAREDAQEAHEAQRERQEAMRDEGQAQAELSRAQAELQRHKVSTGGPVTVEKNSRVESAVAYGGPVIVEEDAVVDGDAVAFGGDVVLKKGAVVQGDAVSFGGNVVREAGAEVQGESVSLGGSSFGTTVARNVLKTQRGSEEGDDEASHEGFGRGLAGFLLQFAVFFGLGFMLMMFAPQRMKALESTIADEPGKNGVIGFLGMLATIPLTLLLVVTLVGIPVAMMMWVGLALFIPVGLTVMANTLGARLPTGKLRKTQALALAVGLFVLLLIGQIPLLGPMVMAAAMFISMGAIIRTRFGQNSRSTPMIDPLNTAPRL